MKKRYHELKTTKKYFTDVVKGNKNFEVRKNDRDFRVGDYLLLMEFHKEQYTGNRLLFQIDSIYDLSDIKALRKGFVVMSISYASENFVVVRVENNMTLATLSFPQEDLKYLLDRRTKKEKIKVRFAGSKRDRPVITPKIAVERISTLIDDSFKIVEV